MVGMFECPKCHRVSFLEGYEVEDGVAYTAGQHRCPKCGGALEFQGNIDEDGNVSKSSKDSGKPDRWV